MIGVESDFVGDIELGCEVFSKAIQAGAHQAGGVVVDTWVTADGGFEFAVLRWREGQPYTHIFEGDDVDMPSTRWWGKSARNEAARLHNWIGQQKRLDPVERADWSLTAAKLDTAGAHGLYLVRAEQRYRARRDDALGGKAS